MTYSRENPSKKYKQLVDLYYEQHHLPKSYMGKSLEEHIPAINHLINTYNCKTGLDYGAGKGACQGGLKFLHIHSYDPGLKDKRELPDQPLDATICVDVMEHIPQDDVDWVIEEIINLSKKFVFFSISCVPAVKIMPNGENAHCTIHNPKWWLKKIKDIRNASEHKPFVRCVFYCKEQEDIGEFGC